MTAPMTAGEGQVREGDFRHRAACRGVDPELFFPVPMEGGEHDRQVAAAKAVCAGCPVRAECLEWALLALPEGVAGGLTDIERRRERVRRRDQRRRARKKASTTTPAAGVAEGSAAATAAPLLSRSNANALAGTRITEGHRS